MIDVYFCVKKEELRMENIANHTVCEKEIELIQSCVNRMAQNSFTIKGWLITLVSVILALLPESVDMKILCGVVVACTLCFWYLDAFYLRLEMLYRWKYEWVIAKRKDTQSHLFDLNPYNEEMWLPDEKGKTKKMPRLCTVMFTKSLIPLYIMIVVLALALLVYSVCVQVNTVPASIAAPILNVTPTPQVVPTP